MNYFVFFVLLISSSSKVLAAGGGPLPHFPNWYLNALNLLGISSDFVPVIGGFFIVFLLTLMGLGFKKYVSYSLQNDVAPPSKFSLNVLVETAAEFVYDLCQDLLGSKARVHAPLLMGLFFFILVNNLSGLFPFLPPSTSNFSANLAMGLVVFLIYNFAGVKEHGIAAYVKHFAGPEVKIPVLGLFLPILIFLIEMISHGFRPVSLGLRLTGNIFGDHMLVSVFTGMVYLFIPSILMFFGVLVSIVQSFVFTLLSGIYISMAVSHDH